MIHLQIIDRSKNKITEIKDFLLSNNYAKSVEIDWGRTRHMLSEAGQETEETVHKLSCITFAAFFSQIQDEVHRKFPGDSIEIYSLPLTYFDWSLKDGLRKETV